MADEKILPRDLPANPEPPTASLAILDDGVNVFSSTLTEIGNQIGAVRSVQAGLGISVNNTDPLNPIVTATEGGGDMYEAVYDPQGISNDAFARENHTGEQPISATTGLQETLDQYGPPPFNTVSELISDDNNRIGYEGSGADFIVAPGNIIEAQGFRYEVAASDATDAHLETAGGVKLYVLMDEYGTANVVAFGAIGDGDIADGGINQAAFQKAVDAIKAQGGGTIAVPDGTFIIDDEIDIWRPNSPRNDLLIKGQSEWNTKILSNFYGASKSLFKCYDPDDLVRSSPTSFQDLFLGADSTAGGVNPVMIRIRGWGESRINRVRLGPSNNTHVSTSSMQNIRGSDITAFYGGKSYAYKDTTGITFTLSGTTLTASAPIFSSSSPNDVGRIMTLMSSTRQKVFISAVVSSTVATVSGDRLTDSSGVDAIFEGGVATMLTGSNQLAGSPGQNIFVPEDVGRIVYVARAQSGLGGASSTLRAEIIEYVAPHAVRLSKSAEVTATSTRFGSPSIDFYAGTRTSTGAGNDIMSSDNKFDKMQIESYAGIGLVLYNMRDCNFTDCKIHGTTGMTSERAAYAALWTEYVQGTFSGQLDSSCASGRERIYIANQGMSFTFPYLFSRNIVNERHFFLESFGSSDGYVDVKNFEAVQYDLGITNMYVDLNTRPRLLFTGLINMLGDINAARVGLGFNMTVGDGFLQLIAPEDVSYVPPGGIAITSAGNLVYRTYGGTLRVVSFT